MPAPPKATSRSSRRRRASARSTRAKGFKDELAAKYPGLKIVADKAANGKAAASGLSIVNELIRRQCEPARRVRLDSRPDRSRRPVDRRQQEGPRDKTHRRRFGREARRFLKDGTIAGLVVQDLYRMGYDGIKTALAASNSKGEKVEARART